jgi:DNA polymerase-3 subunit gamma/tau
MLCLGWKPFSAEIAASAGTLRREESPQGRLLFLRALRKLLARFNPVLWEDDPKGAKLFPLVNSLEEDIDELGLCSGKQDAVEMLTDGMLKIAFKLESEGISENIPIAQIRRAAYWCRLAPNGRGKLLLIENADRMQEEARNSLLKLLEEPPARVNVVLTSPRPGSLLPTMLSRLRPYRFYSRTPSVEKEVIKRVFRDEDENPGGISEYLDSFLPVSGETLKTLAAFVAASTAYKAALILKKKGRPLPEELVLLGKFCTPKAEASGFGRLGAEVMVNLILEKTDSFEIRSLFPRFLNDLLEQVSLSLRQASAPPQAAYNELWKKCVGWADTAAGIYKLRPAQALEKLFNDLTRGLAEL